MQVIIMGETDAGAQIQVISKCETYAEKKLSDIIEFISYFSF